MRRGSAWNPSLLLLVVLAPQAVSAQLSEPEFLVNSLTTHSQYDSIVASDSAGNFVVVWSSGTIINNGIDIYARLFDRKGAPRGTQFRVNTYTTGWQNFPAVAMDADGNFVVAWRSAPDGLGNADVYAQRYDAAGNALGGEFPVNQAQAGEQGVPAVAFDGASHFVVTWASGSNSVSQGLFGRRIESNDGQPLAGDFPVNTYTTGPKGRSAVAATGGGAFVVVWESYYQDGSDTGIFGRRFDSDGQPAGGEFPVNESTQGIQELPRISADTNGGFIVTWFNRQGVNEWDAYARRFPVSPPYPAEFVVNTYTPGLQLGPAVATDPDGSYVVVWSSYGPDDSDGGVYAQKYDVAGNTVGGEFRVNSYTTSGQGGTMVARRGGLGFVVVWTGAGPDSPSWNIQARLLYYPLFADGFESSDECEWTLAVGGGSC